MTHVRSAVSTLGRLLVAREEYCQGAIIQRPVCHDLFQLPILDFDLSEPLFGVQVTRSPQHPRTASRSRCNRDLTPIA